MTQRKSFPTAAYGRGVGYNFTLPPADNDPPAKLVVILGHSYMVNLFSGPIDVHPPFELHKLGARGATIESISSSTAWERVNQFRPALAVLVIGSNNIMSQTTLQELAQATAALMKQVEHLTHVPVIILTIKNRLQPQAMYGKQ